ncbi:MAG: hypothetical protein WC984_04405 [Bacteroidales bacterium]
MIFSIYYINFPKVYEIKMMLSNKVLSEEQVEKQKGFEGEAFLKTKLGFGILDLFKIGDIEANGNIKGSGSKKVLETFEVKTTKSIILNEVVEKSKVITKFEDINEGELIRVDNVNLSLENEAELRIVKMFTNGSFKGMTVPGANGLDFTNLFNSMFKDYAYKMKGTVKSLDNEILVKIPVTFESEFESSYCVDDLFIGKVSLIGLYKGKINIDQLRNSFEFYKDLGELTNAQSLASHPDDEIQDSQYISGISTPYFVSSNDVGKEYYYIDLLAIIQNVNIPD